MGTNSSGHILIIGGTGMLSEVVRDFTLSNKAVSVIARHKGGLLRLKDEVETDRDVVNPIAVDYRNYTELANKISSATENYGEIDTIVSWIHANAPDALMRICQKIYKPQYKINVFELLASDEGKIEDYHKKREDEFRDLERISYHSVLLGAVIEGSSKRWLTHNEISRGVISAVEKSIVASVIGSNLNA